MKAAEIRELTADEIRVKTDEMKKEYLNLRFQAATQQLEKPHLIRKARRDLAKIQTVLSERKKANV